jgi:hypothetical protein
MHGGGLGRKTIARFTSALLEDKADDTRASRLAVCASAPDRGVTLTKL